MNLARIRQARGLSQRDLADMIGMDPSTVQRAETMHKSAKIATYQACADALKVPLEVLFGEPLTDEELELVMMFRQIPRERHPLVRDMFRLAQLPAPPADPESDSPPQG